MLFFFPPLNGVVNKKNCAMNTIRCFLLSGSRIFSEFGGRTWVSAGEKWRLDLGHRFVTKLPVWTVPSVSRLNWELATIVADENQNKTIAGVYCYNMLTFFFFSTTTKIHWKYISIHSERLSRILSFLFFIHTTFQLFLSTALFICSNRTITSM